MGYLTQYTLEIDSSLFAAKNKALQDAEIKEVEKSDMTEEMKSNVIQLIVDKYAILKTITIGDVISLIGYDPFSDSCKWYEHDKDMIMVSKKYKNMLFTLTGYGEDESDIWKKYYYNGKMQSAHAKITFDSFDPAKLM